ncbi:CPBP family intramembrane glutamic endopeptidase [Dysgonomonas sp. 511]|uniref:CPBP family intramembrane glutamic endopeptidase n=1 Tax=Dysgonomonas sp. 511 TaxID=2302930 RepID=UPI0013D189EB|nr:CPBP family intramembrane glutamic endopeptidase [Dysgonomonas sp. 511]NDV78673.1 CPBP family intramembrane metalloprotease [Dysgonomonas sp. 511]
MKLKGILSDLGGWSQLLFMFFLFFSGYILAMLLVLTFVDIHSIKESLYDLRLSMAIQSCCLFLLPAIAFAYLCSADANQYFGIKQRISLPILLFSISLIIVIQPLIISLSYYNSQLALPEWLSSAEEWMRQSENRAKESQSFLLADKSAFGLSFNLLIMAVFAGVMEEFFFRGCVQQIIGKLTKNIHLTVWIAAIIFSIAHFQFYGFIPRVILGAMLGYLFVWSRTIWLPVAIHILHNGMSIIADYFAGTDTVSNSANFSVITIFSLIFSVGLMYLISRSSVKENLT